MRIIIFITLASLFCFVFVSGCNSRLALRPCSTMEDSQGRKLELVMEKTGETLHLGVYHNGKPLEVVSVLITKRRPYGVTIRKNSEVIFDERFIIPEEDEINTPMELSLDQIEKGEAKDPELNPIVNVARKIPKLEFLSLFAKVLPVRVYWESMYSGQLDYADGNVAKLSFNTEELNECTEEERNRQYTLRSKHCDQTWQEYIDSVKIRDTDCLLCALIAIDPCTGLPINAHAFFGCIFGGPIGCGVSVAIAIILWAGSAY